jgi:hypothetical protein
VTKTIRYVYIDDKNVILPSLLSYYRLQINDHFYSRNYHRQAAQVCYCCNTKYRTAPKSLLFEALLSAYNNFGTRSLLQYEYRYNIARVNIELHH